MLMIPTINEGQIGEIGIVNLLSLLCYSDPLESELAYLLSDAQLQLLLDTLNNELLSMQTII